MLLNSTLLPTIIEIDDEKNNNDDSISRFSLFVLLIYHFLSYIVVFLNAVLFYLLHKAQVLNLNVRILLIYTCTCALIGGVGDVAKTAWHIKSLAYGNAENCAVRYSDKNYKRFSIVFCFPLFTI